MIDDEIAVAGGIAEALVCAGRSIFVCSDAESAEVLLEWVTPAAIVCDVRLTGPFRFEGLDFLDHVARRAPGAATLLMSGAVSPELRLEGQRRGAKGVLEKPFALSEVEALLPPCAGEEGEGEVIEVPTLDAIIASGSLRPRFQPIVDLQSGGVRGFESLARLETGTPFANPELLFAYAERKLRVADLELACMRSTFSSAPALAGGWLLFMNLHPAALMDSDRLFDALRIHAAAAVVPLDHVVLELTEQNALPDTAQTHEAIERLRTLGVRFAFDDVGMAYSHLPLIGRIRPAFLKVSQHFGTGFEADSARSKLVANLLSLARDFDASLILEGIETAETAAAARELGIPLGQGYFFAQPLTPADAFSYASGLLQEESRP